MKKLIIPLFAIALFTSSCDIDKKGKTELPEVDVEVDVEEGNLPEFDVDWADVDITVLIFFLFVNCREDRQKLSQNSYQEFFLIPQHSPHLKFYF